MWTSSGFYLNARAQVFPQCLKSDFMQHKQLTKTLFAFFYRWLNVQALIAWHVEEFSDSLNFLQTINACCIKRFEETWTLSISLLEQSWRLWILILFVCHEICICQLLWHIICSLWLKLMFVEVVDAEVNLSLSLFSPLLCLVWNPAWLQTCWDDQTEGICRFAPETQRDEVRGSKMAFLIKTYPVTLSLEDRQLLCSSVWSYYPRNWSFHVQNC